MILPKQNLIFREVIVEFSFHERKINCVEIQLGSTDDLKLNYQCIQREELSTNFKHNMNNGKFPILEIISLMGKVKIKQSNKFHKK